MKKKGNFYALYDGAPFGFGVVSGAIIAENIPIKGLGVLLHRGFLRFG